MGREFELKLAEEQIAILRQSVTQLKADLMNAKQTEKQMQDDFGLEPDAIYWQQRCAHVEAENEALRETIAEITRTTPILTEESDD